MGGAANSSSLSINRPVSRDRKRNAPNRVSSCTPSRKSHSVNDLALRPSRRARTFSRRCISTRPHRSGEESRKIPKFARPGTGYCGPAANARSGSNLNASRFRNQFSSYSNEKISPKPPVRQCSDPIAAGSSKWSRSAYTATVSSRRRFMADHRIPSEPIFWVRAAWVPDWHLVTCGQVHHRLRSNQDRSRASMPAILAHRCPVQLPDLRAQPDTASCA